jgi:homoserine kinase type II
MSAAAPQTAADPLARVLADLAQRLADDLPQLVAQCAAHANQPLPLQWCLRDVRWEHVLFSGDAVTGLIDWGAAAVETVACDLGRLLSDAAPVGPAERALALDAYHAVRPLSAAERAAVDAFQRLAVPLAAANWLQWLVLERRWHADPPGLQRAARRLAELATLWPRQESGAP